MRRTRPLAFLPTAVPATSTTVMAGGSGAHSGLSFDQLSRGALVGGRYQIDEFVAAGAFGAVYRAHDRDIPGHVVALKLMHRVSASSAETARCFREVQLIAAVSHPSVVSLRDHGLHAGRVYIVMPWYQGETLAQRIERGGLSRREAERIFATLAEALAAMHERGVRHQDIKPDNILLARFGEGQPELPILLDLGVGAFADEQLPAFTPAYVAPEMAAAHLDLCRGAAPPSVDGKADVFALALTLFDSLFPGRRPSQGVTYVDADLRARARHGAALPELREGRDIAAALRRWLAVDPAERPSAAGLAEELQVLTRAERQRAERKRLAMLAVAPLAVVLAVVSILAVQLRRERVSSRVKDVRIEQQAQAIDEAHQAIDALGSGQDYLKVSRRNEVLASRLVDERASRAELAFELGQERRRSEAQAQLLRDANERGVLLERELAASLAQLDAAQREADAELGRLKGAHRELERALRASKDEKADLAELVRELVRERDKLSERLSKLTRRRAALLSRLGVPPVR